MISRIQLIRQLVDAWRQCTHFEGTIVSNVDRINNVPNQLTELGVDYLIPHLLVNEKLQAFVFKAQLGMKDIIQVVEIYHDMHPRGTEWRVPQAQFALRLDEDLAAGVSDGVVVTDFVAPFGQTATLEIERGCFMLPKLHDVDYVALGHLHRTWMFHAP